jgi:L-ascorbate metabolism protein UlaG (beta-lactamase superfamily)
VDGAFQNQSHTPVITATGIKDFWSQKRTRVSPLGVLPSMKTDLKSLNKDSNVLVWFGHSSYYIQVDGKSFLVDPVLSGHASPFPFAIKAFKGADRYKPEDFPEIDYLIITHDHWDHLDFKTLTGLKPKIGHVICGLGTGSHLERWGYDSSLITELDWYEKSGLDSGFIANAFPARHFSGRKFKRNSTLWISVLLQTPTMNIFIGGDGGYDKHFAEIGSTFGSVDLAILENGQYNKNWKYIHMMPDKLAAAFSDLKAKRLFTVHNSKFALANHPWDEPLIHAKALSDEFGIPLITPMIGELVNLNDSTQQFSEWWSP